MAQFERSGYLLRISAQDGDSARLVVFGDIHGDLPALEAGLNLVGDEDLVLFLGDFADRGPDGVEVIERVRDLVAEEPTRIASLKGNHEVYDRQGNPSFSPCTLISEAEEKRGSWRLYYPRIKGFFDTLALAALLPGRVLFVHAGIGGELETEAGLEAPGDGLVEKLLWSDPGEKKGEHPSPRGAGRVFGPDVSRAVCAALGVRHIVRSHEPRKAVAGPAAEHEGRIVTINSTRVYGGRAFVLEVPLSAADHGDPQDWGRFLSF